MLRRSIQYFLFIIKDHKVVYDGVDGQGDSYHPTEKTDGCVALAESGFWIDVSITHCGHGDDGPPERLRDAPEKSLRVALLHGVGQRWEDKDPHAHVHEEQTQLFETLFERVSQSLQPGGVPRKLENTRDTHDSERLDSLLDISQLHHGWVAKVVEGKDHVERHDGHEVYDVHEGERKVQLVWRGGETQ